MQNSEPAVRGEIDDEVLAYRQVLTNEIRRHKQFAKITIVSGIILVAAGIAIMPQIDILGWLLVLFGMMRALNSIFDLNRSDVLQKKMKALNERFARHASP